MSPMTKPGKVALFLGLPAVAGAQYVDLGAALVTAALVARFSGASGLGELSLLLALFLAANTMVDFGASALLTREVSREPDRARSHLGVHLRLKVLALVLVSIALLAGSFVLTSGSSVPAGLPFLWFSSINISLAAALRGLRRYGTTLSASVPAFFFQALATWMLLAQGHGLSALMLVLGATQALKTAILLAWFGTGTEPHAGHALRLRDLARAALPFAGVVVLSTLYIKADVFFLSALSGAVETGYYGAAARIADVLKLLPAALATAWFPEMVREEKARAEPSRGASNLLLFSAALTLGGLVFAGAPWLVRALYGPDLDGAAGTLRLLALALVASVMNSVTVLRLYARSEERTVLRIMAAVLSAKLVLNTVLVPSWGADGAAAGWVVSEWIFLALGSLALSGSVFFAAIRRPSWLEPFAWSVLALAVRLILLALYPALYGGDPVARLFHPDKLVLGYQLPGFQALVAIVARLSDDPMAPRVLSAACGAFATGALYLLSQRLLGTRTARVAAALVLVNPLLVVYSLVPYQEPLMLALLALGAVCFVDGRHVAGSLLLGAACWTRYESWVVAAALLVVFAYRGRLRPRDALVFGWGPLVWILVQGGLGPPGTYVADVAWSGERLTRVGFLVERVLVAAPFALVLAPLGLVVTWREGGIRALGFVSLVVISGIVLFGHDYPPGTGGVTERAAHIPLVTAVLLSAAALGRLMRTRPRLGASLLASSVAVSLGLTVRQLEARTSTPEVAACHELALYLDERLAPGQKALVMARPVDGELIEHYLNLIGRRAPSELDAARRLARDFTAPEDYQRLSVSMRRGKERLVEATNWRGEPVSLAVLFGDAGGSLPAGLELGKAERRFERGKKATVFEVASCSMPAPACILDGGR